MLKVFDRTIFSEIGEIVDPAHTALVVIDVQNDFCSSGGLFSRIGKDLSMMQPMIDRLGKVIESARAAGVFPIFVQNQWLPDNRVVSDPFLRFMIDKQGMDPTEGCTVSGTWGAQYVQSVAPRETDVVVHKWRPSAFRGTNLDMVLRCNRIRSVVLTGVITQGCVESTARDAMFHDYYTVVIDDCVATYNTDLHDASLKVMRSRFDVIGSDVLCAQWARHAAAA
jgi:nicotinamidase-related amidase